MAIQSKETLKGYFKTGKKPLQYNFSDLIDTIFHMFTTNLVVNIDPVVSYSEDENNLHFDIYVSRDPDFTSLIVYANTLTSRENWMYFNNVSFQPFPTNGLPYTYQNPVYGRVIYTVPNVERGKDYYIRYRSWDGSNYSNFKTEKINI